MWYDLLFKCLIIKWYFSGIRKNVPDLVKIISDFRKIMSEIIKNMSEIIKNMSEIIFRKSDRLLNLLNKC